MALLQHNWRFKVVALVLAGTTWLFVNGITNDRRLVAGVPLEIETRSGTSVLHQQPLMVDVLVRGTREDMRQVSRQDLAVVLDLTKDTQTGQLTRRVGPASVRHPRWVQPLEVLPSRVTVVIDEVAEKELPVAARFSGSLPPDTYLDGVVVKPDRLMAIGPQNRLAGLASLPTLPIDLTGRTSSFRERVELSLEGLLEVSVSKRTVEVQVRLRQGGRVDTEKNSGVQGTP